MVLAQEEASIIKFVLDSAGNPPPYYQSAPEGFKVPSVFFPPLLVNSSYDTLQTYKVSCTLDITVFHSTTADAHEMAVKVFDAICKAKFLIHLVD